MNFLKRFREKRQSLKNRKKELRKNELFLQVRELLSREFKIENKEKIKLESRFKEDLGLDSVDAIELVMALEEEFNFEIPDDDIEKIFTVEQLVDYLLTRLNNKG